MTTSLETLQMLASGATNVTHLHRKPSSVSPSASTSNTAVGDISTNPLTLLAKISGSNSTNPLALLSKMQSAQLSSLDARLLPALGNATDPANKLALQVSLGGHNYCNIHTIGNNAVNLNSNISNNRS